MHAQPHQAGGVFRYGGLEPVEGLVHISEMTWNKRIKHPSKLVNQGDLVEAKVIGVDPRTDIAVLKIEAKGLPYVRLGDPDSLKVGEWVVAIGSPFGFENSVTAGIVSAKGRSLPQENFVPFLQTDVAINPGNSGGPLFNLRGIQPFHDFPEGPDWWNLDDYKAVFSQLPKLRMNFFGLHTYPEGHPNAEPTVWIGLPQDVAAEAYDYPEEFFAPQVHEIARPRPDTGQVVRAADAIRSAKRPVIIAGGGVRAVCEAVGIRDVLAKSMGSSNHANVVKATLKALSQLRTRDQVLSSRGKKKKEKAI